MTAPRTSFPQITTLSLKLFVPCIFRSICPAYWTNQMHNINNTDISKAYLGHFSVQMPGLTPTANDISYYLQGSSVYSSSPSRYRLQNLLNNVHTGNPTPSKILLHIIKPDSSLPHSERLATGHYHVSWFRWIHYTSSLSKYFISISMLSTFYSLISFIRLLEQSYTYVYTYYRFYVCYVSGPFDCPFNIWRFHIYIYIYIYIYISSVQSSVVIRCTAYCNIQVPPFCPHSVYVLHIFLSINSYYFAAQN